MAQRAGPGRGQEGKEAVRRLQQWSRFGVEGAWDGWWRDGAMGEGDLAGAVGREGTELRAQVEEGGCYTQVKSSTLGAV